MHTHDPYRSRRPDILPALAPRPDPVIWTEEPHEGPLTRTQLDAYARDGFLVLPDVIPRDEVQELLDEAARLAERLRRQGAPECILEPRADVVRSVFRIHELSERFAALAARPMLRGAARQVLDSDVAIHQSRINYKPGLDGQPFHWHSDFETWHTEDGMPRPRALSASVLLTETTPHNGPLLLVPGSQHTYVRTAGETPPGHHRQSLRRQRIGVPDAEALQALIDEGGIVAATGAPGAVVLFDCNTMHGSSGNLLPSPRVNAFFVYNSVDNPLAEPFAAPEPRPSYLAARPEDDGR